jgi:Flp pilus assembly protein CpaB
VAVAQAPARPRAGGGGRLFIIVGVILAIVGFGLAFILPSLSGGGAKGGGSGCPCDLVVYAAKDISLRTQIVTVDQLSVKSIPDAYKPAGAVVLDSSQAGKSQDVQTAAALKAVKGFIAEIDIAQGQPLLTSMLAKPGDTITGAQAAFLPIPSGYVALTLPTSELTGVANYIQPGDYITILAAAGSGKTGATATVFTQLHVIRVGAANLNVTSASATSNTAQSSTATAAPSSITVVVTPCQAEFIKWLQGNLQVSYELESFQDYAKEATGPDSSCPSLTSVKGVQVSDIVAKFPVFQKALGGQ